MPYSYRVRSISRVTPTALLLTVEPTGKQRLTQFAPGQYAAVNFQRFGRPAPVRCFSIASPPNPDGSLQFGMRVKGFYTRALLELRPGDPITIDGPFGSFTIDPNMDRRVVLIAGGIGVTPFISMLRYAERIRSNIPFTLLFSTQSKADVPFAAELAGLRERNPNMAVTVVLSKGDASAVPGLPTANGRITPDLIDAAVGSQYADTTFFICGPAGFMQAMVAALRAKWVPDERIRTEAFSQGVGGGAGALTRIPAQVYWLTALGTVAGTAIVFAADVLRTLPVTNAATIQQSATTSSPTTSSSSRQDQLNAALDQSQGSSTATPSATADPNQYSAPSYYYQPPQSRSS